jgi:guanine deaminase
VTTTAEADALLLTQAIDLATASASGDGGPFGAVLRSADGSTFSATNRVTETNDPTAHAEVVVIREACASLGTHVLEGAVLYSSCEPCPMCLATALWARIDRVVFAADRHAAAAAGFDDEVFYDYFEAPRHRSLLPVVHRATPAAVEPFTAWHANGERRPY